MSSTQASPKEQIREILDQQPEDSSYDEILREIAFHQMIQRGLADVEAGKTITHEEMEHRIRSWAE